LDPSCLPALLDVARPALPPGLVCRLLRWDDLSDAERTVARGDLELLAAIMRMSSPQTRKEGPRPAGRGPSVLKLVLNRGAYPDQA
jgi:hypothetical protein